MGLFFKIIKEVDVLIKNANSVHSCSISGCKNLGKYVCENHSKVFCKRTYICENCLKEIYDFGKKIYVPKGIKNYLNK